MPSYDDRGRDDTYGQNDNSNNAAFINNFTINHTNLDLDRDGRDRMLIEAITNTNDYTGLRAHFSVQRLRQLGYPLETILEARYPLIEIMRANFSLGQIGMAIRNMGVTVSSIFNQQELSELSPTQLSELEIS